MSVNRGRWLINLVLVLSLAVFVGFSAIPLLGSVLSQNQPSAGATSVSPQASSSAERADLLATARGYELVLQREPENLTALRGLVEVRLQLGDLKGSITPLEKLASLNPEQTDYMVLLAQAKQKIGDRSGAAMNYRTVLTSKPGEVKALQGFVSLLLAEERPTAAIALLQDTLKTAAQVNQTQPGSIDSTSIELLLAQVYFNQQRYTEALAIYDRAIEDERQDFRPVLAKALVLQQLGKTIVANPLFTKAGMLAPPQYKDEIKRMAKATPATPTPTISPSIAPAVPTPSPSQRAVD